MNLSMGEYHIINFVYIDTNLLRCDVDENWDSDPCPSYKSLNGCFWGMKASQTLRKNSTMKENLESLIAGVWNYCEIPNFLLFHGLFHNQMLCKSGCV